MPAITLPDLNNAKLDVDHIAAIATSTELTATDRLGQTKRTLNGQMAAVDAELAAKLDDAQSQINVKVNEAAGHASNSAASASQALGYLNTIRATSYGAYASDPATDPLGNPPTVGDEYFNTTANLLKRWNGTTWQASDINTANLAAPSGSSLVGYDGGTVQDVLDGAKSLQDYAALRAYTGRATSVRITTPGIDGFFYRLLVGDPEFSAADNTGTIIVDASGRRWKRLYSGQINIFWFMTPAQIADVKSRAKTLDVTSAVQQVIDYYSETGVKKYQAIEVFFPDGDYSISSLVLGNTKNLSLVGAAPQTAYSAYYNPSLGAGYGLGTRFAGRAASIMIDSSQLGTSTYIKETSGLNIRNIIVDGNGVALEGIRTGGGAPVLEDILVTGCVNDGVVLAESTNGTILSNVASVSNIGNGLKVEGTTSGFTTTFLLTHCKLRENGGYGAVYQAGRAAKAENCIIESNFKGGVLLSAVSNAYGPAGLKFFDSWFENNGRYLVADEKYTGNYQLEIEAKEPLNITAINSVEFSRCVFGMGINQPQPQRVLRCAGGRGIVFNDCELPDPAIYPNTYHIGIVGPEDKAINAARLVDNFTINYTGFTSPDFSTLTYNANYAKIVKANSPATRVPMGQVYKTGFVFSESGASTYMVHGVLAIADMPAAGTSAYVKFPQFSATGSSIEIPVFRHSAVVGLQANYMCFSGMAGSITIEIGYRAGYEGADTWFADGAFTLPLSSSNAEMDAVRFNFDKYLAGKLYSAWDRKHIVVRVTTSADFSPGTYNSVSRPAKNGLNVNLLIRG